MGKAAEPREPLTCLTSGILAAPPGAPPRFQPGCAFLFSFQTEDELALLFLVPTF